jgi:chemotaxis response regulator CheB
MERYMRSRGNKPTHDLIVVGASAGGVEALVTLVQDLPADVPAALFVFQEGRDSSGHSHSGVAPP